MLTKKIFVIPVLFIVLVSGCSDSVTNNNSIQYNSFSIPAWDYSDNHFFIDTLYKTSFLHVMNDSTGILPSIVLLNKIKYDLPSFQVWVQCDNTVPLKRLAVAYAYLPDTLSATGYNNQLYPRNKIAIDTTFFGFFRELSQNEYYINPIAGFIGLKISIPENYAIGVSYVTYEGKKFGYGKFDISSIDTMILKLIKCSNQNPDATPRMWELKMKNIYRLPYSNITQNYFKFDTYYNNQNIFQEKIPGYARTLNQILLLDRRGTPDGLFDYLPNFTIIPETGDIIFPILQPFSDGLRNAGVDSIYFFKELYTQRKTEAQISINSNSYYFRGHTNILK